MDKKILIVDDEQDVVNFLERFLKRFKISGIKATSGEEAMDIYKKGPKDFAFVFLDINMKGMDGLNVLGQIKTVNSDAKVFMITGSQDATSREKAISLGALDYITKPLDLAELKEKIEKYLL